MSEREILRRQEYKRNRKKWATVQLVAICLLVAIALGSFWIYTVMDRTYYIEYTESSKIDYKVQYENNDFFEEEWIGKDQAYISSLIKGIVADFNYTLNMDSSNIEFNYKYNIKANMVISDKNTGNAYYTVKEDILAPISQVTKGSSSVTINEQVSIDYIHFNQIASTFVKQYNLKDSTSTLYVTLDVEVLSSGEQFEQNNQNKYSTSVSIPLAVDTFNIQTTSSAPTEESKVLAYKGFAARDIFRVTGSVSAVLAGLGVLVLLVFLQLTKNEDITYAARVRKLVSSYGSFIQRMAGEFDDSGYQTVAIKSFTEMLGIRDTIQSPILMTENRDETMTRFLIPTNTKLLYVFEIKVDNYDEIYSRIEAETAISEDIEEDNNEESINETSDIIEEVEVQEPVILEEVDEEDLAEAIAQPDVVLEEIEFVRDDDDQFEVAPEEPGIEVVGVVWPERAHKNKVYRYDPNGEILEEGDVILVPTRDAERDRDVIRKVAVAHGNHRVDPEHIKHPLKKVIAIIKRKAANALTPNANEAAENPKEANKAKNKKTRN